MRSKRLGGRPAGVEALECRRLLSFDLLMDAAGLSAASSVTVGGISYFFADGGETGRELWKSNGTGAGTVLVKDLTPGGESTELHSIYSLDGRAVFITVKHNPPVGGRSYNDDYTLWSTDGTAGGTVKLAEFKSTVWFLTRQVGERLAMLPHNTSQVDVPEGWSSLTDAHLWMTDGTGVGTKRVKSFLAAPESGDVPTRSFQASVMLAAGNRVLLDVGSEQDYGQGGQGGLWSSDGSTAGTIELTPLIAAALQQRRIDLSTMMEAGDRVLIPGQHGEAVWLTDGTVDGTIAKPFAVEGTLEGKGYSAVAGNDYYYVELFNPGDSENILPLEKRLWALDLDSGERTLIYRSPGDGSDNTINIAAAGPAVMFTDRDSGTLTTTLWTTDGTIPGTRRLGEFGGFPVVTRPVHIDGASFFIVGTGPYEVDAEPVLGWIGAWKQAEPGRRAGQDVRSVNAQGISRLDLWRTDGTVGGTGTVRTLWEGDAADKWVVATLAEATGKLIVRTSVKTGIDPVFFPNEAELTAVSDQTIAYDPRELMLGRQGATARLVNGILRVGGSLKDDRILLWRSMRYPEKLIVAYNGNERSFVFNAIRRISVDLQAGNDFFQILEGEGGQIKIRTSVFGGDGMDTITTGAARDTILGGGSGDLIRSRGNADVINGGSGRDRINSGVGDDQVAGGTGYDQVDSGTGVDVLFGQTAVEYAFGEDAEGEDLLDDVLLA